MAAQEVDCRRDLTYGLAPHTAVPAVERHVLPQEHTEFVGRLVQLWAGDVGVHPKQVEPRLRRQLYIPGHIVGRGVRKVPSSRAQVGAFQENPFPVDRPDEVLGAHRP